MAAFNILFLEIDQIVDLGAPMNRLVAVINHFLSEEDGSGSTDYGNVFLLVAVALFVIFAAFQGGLLTGVDTVAGELVNKLDSLNIADSGRPTM